MPQPTRLDELADELAAVLRSEHQVDAAHQSLVDLLADRRDTVAAALRIQPRSALRYLDTEAIRDLATGIAAAVTPAPTALDELDLDAPFNAVHCAHYEPAADGLPALHLTPSGLLADELLPVLLTAPQVCLAVEDPHQDCGPEHRAAGPHQQLRLHLNPAADYGHDDCLVAGCCIGCMPQLFDDLAVQRAGWIRRYIPAGHRWVGQTRFRLVNTAASLAAIDDARARLTPA
jgi:hypothetical protein